jgi:hypothetical protein
MRKTKLAAAALTAFAGLLAAPGAANATIAKPEYVNTTSSMSRYFAAFEECGANVCTLTDWVHFQVYSTYSASQIWVNGTPKCTSGGAVPVTTTWCGVGGGNGTAVLNVGIDWQVLDWDAGGLYARMDLLADGQGCTTQGTNSDVGLIYAWATHDLDCETST